VCVREENLDYSDVAYSGKESEKARLQAAIEEFEQPTSAMAEHIRQQVGRQGV
jgi:phosphotransferase system enzyme I (PtsI)